MGMAISSNVIKACLIAGLGRKEAYGSVRLVLKHYLRACLLLKWESNRSSSWGPMYSRNIGTHAMDPVLGRTIVPLDINMLLLQPVGAG
jgi:hypothetical protein